MPSPAAQVFRPWQLAALRAVGLLIVIGLWGGTVWITGWPIPTAVAATGIGVFAVFGVTFVAITVPKRGLRRICGASAVLDEGVEVVAPRIRAAIEQLAIPETIREAVPHATIATTAVSTRSFAETVLVVASPVEAGTQISVYSWERQPVLIDWGKNRANVALLTKALHAATASSLRASRARTEVKQLFDSPTPVGTPDDYGARMDYEMLLAFNKKTRP